MLALVSPAKKLDFTAEPKCSEYTQPMFRNESQELINILKDIPRSRLKALMNLSDKLTDLNFGRYQNYSHPFDPSNSKQAIYALRGDTYVSIDADTLTADEINYAQDHLGILSGLYGILRPLDLMQPYRLEMGTKLANDKGVDLYDFWGDSLLSKVQSLVRDHKDQTIICLASNEYIKSISINKLEVPFLNCHFKEVKDGIPKTIGIFAKRARGMMARYIIQNKIEEPNGLKQFDRDGYTFESGLSDDKNLTFIRNQ